MYRNLIIALATTLATTSLATAQTNRTTSALNQRIPVLRTCCTVTDYVELESRAGSAMRPAILVAADRSSGKNIHLLLGVAKKSAANASRSNVQAKSSTAPAFNTKRFRRGQLVHTAPNGQFAVTASFPIEASRRDEIGASSRTMRTEVTVSSSGRIDGRTRIKTSEAMRGFTGAVEVGLTDVKGNVLYRAPKKSYGVNGTALGKSERTESWTAQAPGDVLDRTAAIIIKHHHDPKNFFPNAMEWVVDNWECVVEVWKYVGEDNQGNKQYQKVENKEDMEAAQQLLQACKNIFA